MSISLKSLIGGTVFLLCTAIAQAQENAANAAGRLEPFGGKRNEERLVKLIQQTLPPRDEPKPDAAKADALLPWSQPVRGLSARIECISYVDFSRLTVLVRLKNVSARPLVVPTGNSRDTGKPRVFELYVREREPTWKRIAWRRGEFGGEPEPEPGHSDSGWLDIDRPPLQLRPGESGLAYLWGWHSEFDRAASIKIVLRQPIAQDAAVWSGVLETLPRAAYPGWDPRKAGSLASGLSGKLPFPDHFPAFSHSREPRAIFANLDSRSQEDTDNDAYSDAMMDLRWSNEVLLDALYLYDDAGVRQEFERRMLAEQKDRLMKLLLATTAAQRGSQQAALFLLETMKDTRFWSVVKVREALCEVLAFYRSSNAPDWVVELAIAVLVDKRLATGRYYDRLDGRRVTISHLAKEGGIAGGLAAIKCRKVVPLLIEMVQRGDDPAGEIEALGRTGDPRAIPVLLDRLKLVAKNTRYVEGTGITSPTTIAFGFEGEFPRLAQALTDLHAKDATPVLLQYLELPYVTYNLEHMGDPRAIPALRELVAAKGRVMRNGQAMYPNLEPDRLFGARLALAVLDEQDRVGRLAELLRDNSLSEFQRTDVVWRLQTCGDPRAIPDLVRAIRTDPSGWVVTFGITALSTLKSKAAVEALIDCFDVDFRNKEFGKGEGTPDDYHDRIARSLRELTGERFGPDKRQWLDWWRRNKETSGLK